ncbi:MAG: cellulase family glycosylhydrolase, partial [Isosphaeraceae bacterium]
MFSCNRRDALKVGLASACWIHGGGAILADATSRALPEATAKKLPRWRGFNLLQKFQVGSASPFAERDFAEIAELGFNFVRLPMDYRCWTKRSQPRVLDEPVLREVDQAVAFGKKHGVHVQLNFHRAPGFTVAEPPEPTSLWTDEETQAVCAHHWKTFATRYAGR